MAVRDERRAVVVLALLAAAGGLVRLAAGRDGPPGAPLVAPEVREGDLVRQAARARRAAELARPLLPGERVDVDRAAADELERLPRVGRKLAQRIVAEREANGPFGGLEGLRRVSGIGPAMLAALDRSASFSGVPRPAPPQPPGGPASARAGGAVVRAAARAAPPADGGPVRAAAAAAAPAGAGRAPPARSEPACGTGPVAVNTATAEELDCLPGIGPALAARIVADRADRGPYARLEDLDRVSGIGPRLRERLRGRVRVP